MARTLSTVNFYKNINLPRDYSQVCDNITLNNISSYLSFTITNLSVIRHNIESGSFRVEKSINDLSYINYICILNNSTDRSQIYAFIDNLEYIADNITNVTFSIDLFTTYCQGLDYQDTYISRMTTSDDTYAKYLESEPVDGLDYKTNYVKDEVVNEWYYGGIRVADASGVAFSAQVKNNVITKSNGAGLPFNRSSEIDAWLDAYLNGSHPEGLVDIIQYPSVCGELMNPHNKSDSLSFLNNVDGYTPKNNKLLTYPYVRAIVIDSDGGSLEIKPELCQNRQIDYNVDTYVVPMCNMSFTLNNYDGNSALNEKEQRLIITGFPQVTWSNDNYRAWLARNKTNIAIDSVKIVGNVIGSAVAGYSGNYTASLALGNQAITGLVDQYAQNENAKQQTNTIHRGGNISLDIANGKFGFQIYLQSITARQASLIDNFFTAFGYAINKVTYFSPSRTRFDYVETKGNLFRRKAENSGVPNIALDTINSRANSGIRIWHSVSELNRGNLVDTNSIR